MMACILKAVGQLHYGEAPKPEPKRGEVLLRIKRCGICSSDIDRVFQTGTYHFPTIPGHEFSGEIVALGDGVDAAYFGRRAAVFPLLPCFQCPSCAAEEYARCDSYSYFGSRCDGAFAEYLAVPTWNLALFSESVSYDSAALCEPAAVALHAVKAGQIKAGDAVAIVGSGTIGLLAAMWAGIQGADQIIIIGRGEEKLKAAQKLGFPCTVSSLTQDPVKEVRRLTDGRGADVVLEMAGGSEAVGTAVACAKKSGSVVLAGNPTGEIVLGRNVYWGILRGELNIRGTWNSSYGTLRNDWTTVLDHMERGLLPAEKLITHHFPLCAWKKAFDTLLEKKGNPIKVMFDISD